MVPLRDAPALGILTKLIEPVFDEVAEALSSGSSRRHWVRGRDLALLCAYLGAQVDAIDHMESSFNQMRGIDVLRKRWAYHWMFMTSTSERALSSPAVRLQVCVLLGHAVSPEESLLCAGEPGMARRLVCFEHENCPKLRRVRPTLRRSGRLSADAREATTIRRIIGSSPDWIAPAFMPDGLDVFGHERIGPRLSSDPVHPRPMKRNCFAQEPSPRHPACWSVHCTAGMRR